MIDALSSLLQFLLTVLGGVATPPDGMLAVAAILVTIAMLALVLGVLPQQPGIRSAPHPRRAIDVSTRLAQSHPDADGHPRPRAPGVAFAA